MYKQWSPPPKNRRQLQQLELKKRHLKRRCWQFSASIFLFSFVFSKHQENNYQHILPYLPQEVTTGITTINGVLSREMNYFRSFLSSFLLSDVEKDDPSSLDSLITSEEGGGFLEETVFISTDVPSYYEESLEIFSVQGDQLWTDILQLLEPEEASSEGVTLEESGVISAEEAGDSPSVEEESPPVESPKIGEILEYIPHDLPETHSEHWFFLGDAPSVSPVKNVVTSPFGLRTHPLTGAPAIHNGVDLRSSEGTPISVWREGEVSVVGYTSIVGNYVRIDHGEEIYSFYAHCKEINVKQGEKVSTGDIIATVGSTGDVTGAHLHFEITYQGVFLNPLHYIEYSGIIE